MLTFHYEESDIEELDESTLQIHFSDDPEDGWEDLETEIDPEANEVSVKIPETEARKRSSSGQIGLSGVWTISGEPVKVAGDLNGDGEANLTDAILALKVLSGIDTHGLIPA